MDVNVAKLISMIILKKAEIKSLPLMWIKCLYNFMQVNKGLLNFIKKKNYGNIHLDDLSEWISIDYFENFKTENLKYSRLSKIDEIPVDLVNWRSLKIKNPLTNREIFVALQNMPALSNQHKNEIQLDQLRIIGGKLEFIFRINKNNILRTNVLYQRDVDNIKKLLYIGCKNEINTVRVVTPQVQKILKGTKYENPSLLDISLIPPLTITLKEYQKENIRWILNVENDAPLTIPYIPAIPVSNGKLWVNPIDETISHIKPPKQILQIYGGVILDTVGMGKTIVAIVSSLMNPPSSLLGTHDKIINEKKVEHRPCIAKIESKTSKRKGELCGKKSVDNLNGLCKTHLKSYMKTQLQNSNPTEETKQEYVPVDWSNIFDKTKKSFLSRATLIIVTNTLPSRWMSEMNLLKNRWDYNILQIISKHDYETTTYRDVINADFIITTFDFITFNLGFHSNTAMKVKMDAWCEINAFTPTSFYGQNEVLSMKQPFFQHFYWHRIIVDEIHTVDTEKFKHSSLKYYLCKLRANFKWCLSGSAFINNLSSYTFMLDFLYTARSGEIMFDLTPDTQNTSDTTDDTASDTNNDELFMTNRLGNRVLKYEGNPLLNLTGHSFNFDDGNGPNPLAALYPTIALRKSFLFLKHYHHKNIFDKCFRCNSYESAKNEIAFDKPLTFKNYIINLSSAENAIYQTRLARYHAVDLVNDEYLRQICCHPRLNVQIDKNLNMDNLTDICNQMYRDLIQSIRNSYVHIVELRENVLYFTREVARYGDKSTVSVTNWAKVALKKEKAALTRETNERTRMITALKKFDNYEFESKVVSDDIDEPHLGLYTPRRYVKYKPGIIDPSIDFEINIEDIDKYGSKLTYLIGFLKKELAETVDSKYIIFSQWDSYITLIANALKENNIQAYSCKGNVFQKRKAVKLFKEKNVPVVVNNDEDVTPKVPKKPRKKKIQTTIPIVPTTPITTSSQTTSQTTEYSTTFGVPTITTITNTIVNTENKESEEKVPKKRVKKEKENCRIILLSIKSADSGLDLPEANKIIFMDWIKGKATYKKCIKTQAIGRARRMGQDKKIEVIHFVAKNTIDEEMLIEEEESDDGDVGDELESGFQSIGNVCSVSQNLDDNIDNVDNNLEEFDRDDGEEREDGFDNYNDYDNHNDDNYNDNFVNHIDNNNFDNVVTKIL